MNNRIEIINGLIAKNNYKSYLEIGVRDGSCFWNITPTAGNNLNMIGVDPDTNSAATHFVTSDQFFSNTIHLLKDEKGDKLEKFDIIFIDGLHHADQVYRDIINSLAVLNEGGTIVMHDCLPTTERMQLLTTDPTKEEWTGDTWKAYVKLRTERADLAMFVVNCDYGVGIITRGAQTPLILKGEMTYENFTRNKAAWLNVIPVETFKSYLNR